MTKAATVQASPASEEPSRSQMSRIAGQPPSGLALPPGCPFEPRCGLRLERCRTERPLLQLRGHRAVACYRAEP